MSPTPWWQPDVQQRAFRAVLDGFARPGTQVAMPAQDAVLLFLSTVVDESVSLADPLKLLAADTRRLLMAPSAPVGEARFVLLDGRQTPDPAWQPALGTLESPELGATLVLTVDDLHDAAPAPASQSTVLQLQGPGIPGTRGLAVSGLHPGWLERRAHWVAAYPLGVDLVLAAPQALVALPRTTRISSPAGARET